MQYYYESNADGSNYCYLAKNVHPHAEQHFHAATELVVVEKGKMLAEIDGKRYEISAGQGCFVDKLLLHGYDELTPDTTVYVLVGDSALWARTFAEIGGKPSTTFAFDNYAIIDAARALYEHQNARLSAFRGLIAMICAQIAVNNTVVEQKDPKADFDIFPVLYYIDENFRSPITLTGLATRFGYSPQYFSKIFHRAMNVNLTEYVNTKRATYADALLSSRKTVAEIAEEAGFCSTVSFYRAYKKTFGKLPRS